MPEDPRQKVVARHDAGPDSNPEGQPKHVGAKPKTRQKRRPGLHLKCYQLILLIVAFVGALLLWGPTIYANLSTRSLRYDLDHTNIKNVPFNTSAIVFGAGIYPNGTPTPYLQWRIETAVQLYKAHRVEHIIMSGDNSTTQHNEPVAMAKYAEKLGVPPGQIILDYAGYDTYDTCYRAKAIFGITRATLVSQGYHLPRAVMACNSLGVKSIGVDAEHDQGRSWGVNYVVREWLSTDKIIPQLLFKPKPAVLGPPEPIAE